MATIRRNGKDFLIRTTNKLNTKVSFSHICDYCGKDFISARTTAKYCTVNCKQAAYHERNREAFGYSNISYYYKK